MPVRAGIQGAAPLDAEAPVPTLQSLSLRYDGSLSLLDQRLLPEEERWIDASAPEACVAAIQGLAVRGAPLIGVSAALCLAATAERGASRAALIHAAARLRAARPTAVNLMGAVDRVLAAIHRADDAGLAEAVISEATALFTEDVALCAAMAAHGAALIQDGEGLLTHCNTGGLATAGVGTALGVIRLAHEQGRRIHVFVDETRPLLQGGRLTTWELRRLGVPYTLISDSMAALILRDGRAQRVLVGADRIARNGDFANKVGTYGLAVLARHHGLPFYCVAPTTTLDPACPDGAAIPIELRSPEELRGARGQRWAPADAPTENPAFDVTPASLVTAWVLETGVVWEGTGVVKAR